MSAGGHVFISYARSGETGRTWSARIREYLEARGQRCWRDEESISAGESIARGVPDGLEGASALILVVSRSVGDSDWVMGEIDQAASQGLTIIPAIVERGAKQPVPLRTIKSVDFTQDESAAWAALETALGIAPTGPMTARELELRYLDWFLTRRDVEQNRILYVDLAANEQDRQAACRPELDPQWLMPDLDHTPATQTDDEAVAVLDDLSTSAAGDAARVGLTPKRLRDVRDALQLSRDFVILGEPGAGKTFSLWRIAAELAELAKHDPAAPLPVIVPLGLWIQPVRPDEADPLGRFVEERAFFRNGESVLGPLRGRYNTLLQDGRLALLLDGLNELPTHQRQSKGDSIRALHRMGAARLVVSCRATDFASAELHLPLSQVRVRPLQPWQIHRFVHAYLEFADPAEGTRRAESMFWRLAGGEAMRRLWETYREAGMSWEAFWSSDPATPSPLRGLDRWLPWRRQRAKRHRDTLQWWETERIESLCEPRSLLQLARNPYLLRMMTELSREKGPEALDGNRAAIFGQFVKYLIAREDAAYRRREGNSPHPAAENVEGRLGQLAWELQTRAGGPDKVQLAMDVDEARELIGRVALDFSHAANLLEVGESVRFSHQLLQEYFAALGLHGQIASGTVEATSLWPPDRWWEPSGWEETAVFVAGMETDDLDLIIAWLRDAQPRLLVRCLEEIGGTALGAEQRADLQSCWLQRLDPEREPAPEARHHVATALGALGLDHRRGVGLDANGLPDIDWVEIPAGPFLYGEDKEERKLPTFSIARYPITNTQFQAFIEDGGYGEKAPWWEGLAKRFDGPAAPGWQEPNRPRETVAWYEAMAFCRWLSNRLACEVRLPTEFEWEKAARGTDGREYPWGDGYRAGFANINEKFAESGPSYLEQTTAVGLYPHAASPNGVGDLAGNVWEWCLNEYGHPEQTGPGGNAGRALRGGSWHFGPGDARASNRYWLLSDARGSLIGFRVMCSSPMSR